MTISLNLSPDAIRLLANEILKQAGRKADFSSEKVHGFLLVHGEQLIDHLNKELRAFVQSKLQ